MSEGSILPLFEHYDDHVDKTFNLPMITIATLFNRAVQNHPEKIFIKYYEYQFTYEEIGKLARTLAKNLISNWLKKGECIAIFLPKIPQFIIVYYGVLLAGGIVVAMNPNYTRDELEN